MGDKCKPENPKADDDTFESSGTVRLKYGSDGRRISEIYFTSAKPHTIDHRGKRYAVFVSDPSTDGSPFDAKLVELKDGYVGIEVDDRGRDAMLRDLALSAIKSVGVDVSVTISGDRLHHQSAVVPAQSHTK